MVKRLQCTLINMTGEGLKFRLYIFQKNRHLTRLRITAKHRPTKVTVVLPALVDDEDLDEDIDTYIDPKLLKHAED